MKLQHVDLWLNPYVPPTIAPKFEDAPFVGTADWEAYVDPSDAVTVTTT